ncbi:hypothetical protein [uncultured Algibacter sp.]
MQSNKLSYSCGRRAYVFCCNEFERL